MPLHLSLFIKTIGKVLICLFILSDWGVSLIGKILPSLKLNQESFLIKSLAAFILMIIIFENWGLSEVVLRMAKPLEGLF